ncbi:prephenate dehydratase [Croceiramulus getboli]|nr:prephenate dehydratase [Flavobacteriaceae bacterium YJPT1-3]
MQEKEVLTATKVAIQGIAGSFHHQVAQEYFGSSVQIEECRTFQNIADSLQQDQSSHAVMAIENSIAGAILPNYALLDEYNLYIEGEYYLNIHHHLMALPGQDMEDIREVWSHPMALLQCRKFFRDYPDIKLVEDIDTADVARRIEEQHLKGIAAIASQSAAQIYHLQILSAEIQTINENATRFFILKRRGRQEAELINKASIRFTTEHKRGSLAAVLNVMSDCKLNLTKIQSLPVIDQPWKYAMFVDVTFEQYAHFEKAEALLKIMTPDFKVLGTYKNQQS